MIEVEVHKSSDGIDWMLPTLEIGFYNGKV